MFCSLLSRAVKLCPQQRRIPRKGETTAPAADADPAAGVVAVPAASASPSNSAAALNSINVAELQESLAALAEQLGPAGLGALLPDAA